MLYPLGLAFVGAIGLLNLVLLLGVLRRLADRENALNEPANDQSVAKAGTAIGAFTATAVDGRMVTRDALTVGDVIGFFSPTCAPCIERVPEFAAYAEALAGTGVSAIAVVIGDDAASSDMVAKLSPSAVVISATRSDGIVTAFAASGYPALYLVGEDHVIAASGHTMRVLPTLVPAP
jgi:hypothetical protein